MQKLQRQAGRLLNRTADDAQVALLMKDFDEGDRMLKIVRTVQYLENLHEARLLTITACDQIIEAAKAFRLAWTELVQRAAGMATDFDATFQFLPGADAQDNAKYAPSSREQLAKVRAYKEAMTQLRDVVIQELAGIERRVSMPAKEARNHIDVYRKMIKKREDRKVGTVSSGIHMVLTRYSLTGNDTRVGQMRSRETVPSLRGRREL
jgi:hypothetical protein